MLAPVTGRVGRARVTRGNLVSGGSGESTVLTTIVSVDPIRLYFSPDERSARRLLERLAVGSGAVGSGDAGSGDSGPANGVPLEMQLAGETGFPRAGVLDFLDNRLDEQSGTLLARGVFPNPTGDLLPGMFARVRLRLGEPHSALLVPPAALVLDQTQEILYVVGDDDIVERRQVETGPEIDGLLVVESGLAAGERIVVEGLQSARPGAPVSPEAVTATAGSGVADAGARTAGSASARAGSSEAGSSEAGSSEDGSSEDGSSEGGSSRGEAAAEGDAA